MDEVTVKKIHEARGHLSSLFQTPSANQGDSENGLQSPQLMAIGHTRYDGAGISQVKSQRNICDHEASSDSQFTMEFTIGYNFVPYSNLS